ncbi:MAG: NADH-dependent [FeFe] hydrogenase, group A6 [Firmicutes bacterium]|nr:NADH-dependent [FeFe] hydrogenase, group A6 [Bacillota bacterium]MDD7603072.1 NADH-dependent [FeFe] hydrogenase, group A6 [Bacillota bacterium]
MSMVNLKINGIPVEVPAGSTVLEAARKAGIRIPTLCYLKDINEIGACRMCLVEVKGARSLVTSCVYPVSEGMEVFTNTPAVQRSHKATLELLLSNHRKDCLSCPRSTDCELQALCREYDVDEYKYGKFELEPQVDNSAVHLVRDNSKCILCRRCVAVCRKTQFVGVIGPNDRGFDSHIGCSFDIPLAESSCINCGQCIAVCPTGALTERDDTGKVWEALADPSKHVVVGTAPSVRAQLGECFGMPIGTNVEGKMVAALRRLGFDKVFDVDAAADLTIMEEGTEFLNRLKNGGKLPMITSCSPGWVKFCETYYPDMIENLSSCKSPQGMFGAMVRSYYAEKHGIDPKDIVIVSIMPCTAKKFEVKREELSENGLPDIDVSLTTRELAAMIRKAGLMFTALPDEDFDPFLGIASGAGHIFGATGGVMEAALRTVSEVVTGKPCASVDFHEVRGVEAIKEAEYDLAGTKVRVAVTSGLSNAAKLLDRVKSGEAQYDFIEVMACPGGCVNGGGQPHQPGEVRNFTDLRAERAKALYSEDAAMTLRKSHENPVIKDIYENYLGEVGGHRAHELLHTTYTRRNVY